MCYNKELCVYLYNDLLFHGFEIALILILVYAIVFRVPEKVLLAQHHQELHQWRGGKKNKCQVCFDHCEREQWLLIEPTRATTLPSQSLPCF